MSSGIVEIPLYSRDEVVAYTVIDAADAHLAAYRWRLMPHIGCYAVRRAGNRLIYLHREILGLGPRKTDPGEVDHRDHNTLDNRRANLRVVTTSENQRNRLGPNCRNHSGYRGVYWLKRQRKWKGEIRGERAGYHYVGVFDTPEAAYVAVEARRRELGYLPTDELSVSSSAGPEPTTPAPHVTYERGGARPVRPPRLVFSRAQRAGAGISGGISDERAG